MATIICTNCQCKLEYEESSIEPFTVCECAECNGEIVIPKRIHPLILQHSLGRKSFFDVYDGYDSDKNMASRIFLLDRNTPQFSILRQNALTDIYNINKLRHPNISPIVNHGDIDDGFFVTEPKIDGYAMDSYDPATQAPLEIANVTEIFRLVGKAVAFAHHRNLIHHDICPENIHIDARGTIRLKNYFISRFVYETELQLGADPSVSPMFISPERVKGQPEDMPSDICSFGATFYFLMTGQYPFYGENKDEILHSRVMNTGIRKKESEETYREDVFNTESPVVDTGKPSVQYRTPTNPSSIRPEIPAEMSDLLMGTMKPNAAVRPRISAIMGALEEYNAMLDRKKGIEAAQRQMVLTKTIGINVSAFRPKKKSKGITSLFKQD